MDGSKLRAAAGPVLLLLLGGLAVLSAGFRLSWMAEGWGMASLPADFEGAHYVEQAPLALLHLLPGVAFMLLGPWQFSAEMRRRWPSIHRMSGRVFVVSGMVVGCSAVAMNWAFPAFGGPMKVVVNASAGAGMVACLLLGMWAILRRDVPTHRAWMMRAYALGLGVSTQRLVMLPLYLALGGLSDAAIVIGQASGWLLNLAVVEVILWRGRTRRAARSAPRLVRAA
ncbi:MAG: DUF2306 domain-containing protein [Myxococcales bacterium]|nr:DUF2306 domain-containing protein [Myxococcales bacterium]